MNTKKILGHSLPDAILVLYYPLYNAHGPSKENAKKLSTNRYDESSVENEI